MMSNKDDLTRAAELQPQVHARYCHKEVELGFTVSMSGKRLPEITGIEPLPLAA